MPTKKQLNVKPHGRNEAKIVDSVQKYYTEEVEGDLIEPKDLERLCHKNLLNYRQWKLGADELLAVRHGVYDKGIDGFGSSQNKVQINAVYEECGLGPQDIGRRKVVDNAIANTMTIQRSITKMINEDTPEEVGMRFAAWLKIFCDKQPERAEEALRKANISFPA
ncbi:hypothetical protein BDD12DRAFT_984670 [Trichophaea hybrida]|nr:hypothetical protein BDD12DRAFT_984670 [Trichophaea hybrida]